MNFKSNPQKRSLMILVLAVAALLLVGTALAQGPRRGAGAGFGEGHRLEMLTERLELTEDQVTTIEGIHAAGREKNLELRKELMQLNHDLQGEMMKDDPSENSALGLVKKIGAVKTEVEANRLQARLEVRKQLTPEQRDKMLVLRERFHGGKGGKGGRGHRGGGQGARCQAHGDCDGSGQGRGQGPRAGGKDL